jgi:hypothetical protein
MNKKGCVASDSGRNDPDALSLRGLGEEQGKTAVAGDKSYL